MPRKKKSATALLFHQESTLVEAGHYEITATVPTGIGKQTLIVRHTIRRIADRRWALLDEDGVTLHSLASKRDAVITSDRLIAAMVRKAEQVAEERKASPAPEEPVEPTAKVRYPFDADTAHASLMECSSEYRSASLIHGERMLAWLLADWYLDRRFQDMSLFAREWVVRRHDNGMEGHYPSVVVTAASAASGRP